MTKNNLSAHGFWTVFYCLPTTNQNLQVTEMIFFLQCTCLHILEVVTTEAAGLHIDLAAAVEML